MADGDTQRRLAAILMSDIAGFSALVEQDEEGTLSALKALREELIDPGIARHRGLRDFETARLWTRRAVQHPSADYLMRVHHVATLGYTGPANGTEAAVRELKQVDPRFSIESYRNKSPFSAELAEIAIDGLKAAGIGS